jgi:VCBS repeat-containing protein
MIATDGTWTYTLNNADADTQALDQDEIATDVFRYTVSDPQGNSGTALLTVSITGTNDTPMAVANTRTMNEGGAPLTGAGANNVLLNDVDPDGLAEGGGPLVLTVSQVNGDAGNVGVGVAGTYGTLNMAATGNYTYTLGAAAEALDQGEVVTETFTYNAIDDFGAESGPANLTITLTGVADPTQFAAATRAVNVGENQTTVTTVMAMDADMEPLTYTITGGADEEFFNLDPMTGALTFILPPDFEMPQDTGANNGYVVPSTCRTSTRRPPSPTCCWTRAWTSARC